MTVREEIEQLKREKNAVILAHYYVRPEVQELADYIGDSFYLSKVAAQGADDSFLRGFIYGRERKSAESREDGAYAGCTGRLCHGAYG